MSWKFTCAVFTRLHWQLRLVQEHVCLTVKRSRPVQEVAAFNKQAWRRADAALALLYSGNARPTQALGHKRCPWHYFSISSLTTGSISLTFPQMTWFCSSTASFIARLCLHIHHSRIQSWSRNSDSWQHARAGTLSRTWSAHSTWECREQGTALNLTVLHLFPCWCSPSPQPQSLPHTLLSIHTFNSSVMPLCRKNQHSNFQEYLEPPCCAAAFPRVKL